MCMAQSGKTYNGLEADIDLDLTGVTGADLEKLILTQPPSKGSRLDALNQLWANLISIWISEKGPVLYGPLPLLPFQYAGQHTTHCSFTPCSHLKRKQPVGGPCIINPSF
jgi:hypothetical protein